MNPRFGFNLTQGTQARCPVTLSRAHDEANKETPLEARSKSRAASPANTPPTMRRSCTALHIREGK
jgi:hypothetical protein